MIRSGLEAMDDGGVEFVRVGEVEIEAAVVSEPLGAQGTLVEATRGVEDECVVLEFTATSGGEDAVWTVERWQEWRHTLVGEREISFRRWVSRVFIDSRGCRA